MDLGFRNPPLDYFRENLSALYQNLQNTPPGPQYNDLQRQIIETETIIRQSEAPPPPLFASQLALQNQQRAPQVPVTAAPGFVQLPTRQNTPHLPPIQMPQPHIQQNNRAMDVFEDLWDLLEAVPPRPPPPVDISSPESMSQAQLEEEMVPQEEDWGVGQIWNNFVEEEAAATQLEAEHMLHPHPEQQGTMIRTPHQPLPLTGEQSEEEMEQVAQRERTPIVGFRVKRGRSVSADIDGSSFREQRADDALLLMGASLAGTGQKRLRNSGPPENPDLLNIIPEESVPKFDEVPDLEDVEIAALFNSIRPDLDISAADRAAIVTPAALNIELKDYQKLGFAWLKKMEHSNAHGGILADDMGLGKTVQTLALIADHRPQGFKARSSGVSHTTLLVTPKSLLKQWEAEILSKVKQTPEHRLSVIIYHGDTRKKDIEILSKYDVVITTYGVIASEFKLYNSGRKDKNVILSSEAEFFRCVLDEAQTIKNRQTQMSQGCCMIKAKYRLCLSGTPMQNRVGELFPLFKFLRIPKYMEWSNFNYEFVTGISPTKMERLKALLCTLMLRRHKLSTLNGKPIISLPEKTVHVINIPLSEEEMKLYKEMEVRTRGQYRQIMRDGSIENKYTQILVLLLRLRQIACHHYLTPSYIGDEEITVQEDENGNIIIPSLINHLMGKFKDETIKRVVESNILSSEQECPICFEPQEGNETDILFPCGHSLCADCLVQLRENKSLENRQNGRIEEAENGVVNCPTCRSRVCSKESVVDLKIFSAWCQRNGKIPKPAGQEDGENNNMSFDSKVDADSISLFPTPSKGADPLRGRPWASSAKVDKCIEILHSIASAGNEKTLIFSQFTTLLDLLSHALTLASIPFGRFDGSMHETARSAAINNFQTNPHAKVLLISIKAGNTGLNLIQASQVIMMDPMYNPYVEHQAVDRAHRIGQQRDVTIHRLIAEGTIEERVLKRQEEKIRVVEEALQEGAGGRGKEGSGKLKPEELKYLLFGRK